MSIRPLLISVLVYSLVSAVPASAAWRQFQTENFEMFINGGGDHAREFLNHLEQARAVFSKVAGSSFESDKPVRVIVYNSAYEFDRLQGRGESAYAFYTQSRERNYMVFQELNADAMYETAVHEYTHLRSTETGLSLPFWLSEGLAGFYSTMWPDGDQVRVGLPPRNVKYFKVNAFPSLDVLLAARRGAPETEKSVNRVRNIYIKGWALTRLLATHEEYRPSFPEYLLTVSGGVGSEEAFREVYGKTLKQVNRDLYQQVDATLKPLLIFGPPGTSRKLRPNRVSSPRARPRSSRRTCFAGWAY